MEVCFLHVLHRGETKVFSVRILGENIGKKKAVPKGIVGSLTFLNLFL